MAIESISLRQARRICLHAQGFSNTRFDYPDTAGDRGLRAAMDRMHLLQLDSIPIITRTQYLPLYSRLGHYEMNQLDRIAYGRDAWIETWAHEASLIPVRYQPLFRWLNRQARDGGLPDAMQSFARENKRYIGQIKREIRDRGPLRAAELHDPRPISKAGVWGRGSMGAIALNWLFRTGQLGIRRVGNFEKQFDLIERIVPSAILDQRTPTRKQAITELLVMAARAYGVATADDLIDYFRLPVPESRQIIQSLLAEGRLQQFEVEAWSKPALACPQAELSDDPNACCTLVSPFDPIVWYRDRLARLFDFDYRIEIYVPQKKRRWGYYVLPFLMNDRVVARVDLKNERATRTLRVPGAFIEPGQSADIVAPALAGELVRLARFIGCERVVAGRRGDLIDALRSATKRHNGV